MQIKIEDEQKFLVLSAPLGTLENGVEILQGYLCEDPPIRVRIENGQRCFLTIKLKKAPGSNLQFEAKISLYVARNLLEAHKYNKIFKTRYRAKRLEVDVFHGRLAGLVLIEFEKKSPEEKAEIPTGFIVQEVTGDERFENHNLAKLDSIPDDWRRANVSENL